MKITIQEIAKQVLEWTDKYYANYEKKPSLDFLENLLSKLYDDIIFMKHKDIESKYREKYKKENEELMNRAFEAEQELQQVKNRQRQLMVDFLVGCGDISLSDLLKHYNTEDFYS